VEAAMRRILDSSYGVCERTGKRIPTARLRRCRGLAFARRCGASSTGEITPRPGTLRPCGRARCRFRRKQPAMTRNPPLVMNNPPKIMRTL
jgi:hypothetical protein